MNIKCEICGGNDIIRQDGIYVCQGCGIRYSKEDIQSMLGIEKRPASAKEETDESLSAYSTETIANVEEGLELCRQGEYERAFELFTKAAKAGNPDGQYYLGLCYERGHGTQKDEVLAVKWYLISARLGNPKAQNELAMNYTSGIGVDENYEEALHWATLSAKQGNSDALITIGLLYEHGRGVPQSFENAFSYYLKAAEQGNKNGMSNTGMAYLVGRGVKQDSKKAAKWNQGAAELGEPSAQYNIALQYIKGDGVEEDLDKAIFWLKKAAKQGHPGAIDRLERVGITVEEDEPEEADINSTESISYIKEQIESICKQEEGYEESGLRVGDILKIGSYPQDYDQENTKEPIEWIVWGIHKGKALLLSKQIIDYLPLTDNVTNYGSWKDWTIRTWLNQDFYNAAFSDLEKKVVSVEHVDNWDRCAFEGKNKPSYYQLDNLGFTQDRVFLLSVSEATRRYPYGYLDELLMNPGSTEYAEKKNKFRQYTEIRGWWLRTDTPVEYNAVYALCNSYERLTDEGDCDGEIYILPGAKDQSQGIRPAMWINISSYFENIIPQNEAKENDSEHESDEDEASGVSFDNEEYAKIVMSNFTSILDQVKGRFSTVGGEQDDLTYCFPNYKLYLDSGKRFRVMGLGQSVLKNGDVQNTLLLLLREFETSIFDDSNKAPELFVTDQYGRSFSRKDERSVFHLFNICASAFKNSFGIIPDFVAYLTPEQKNY